MYKMQFLIFISLISLLSFAYGEETLCNPDEIKSFSCSIKSNRKTTKIVSLCASKNLSETEGSIFYRFGTKQHIELNYPEMPMHPKKWLVHGLMNFSDASGDFFRFERGEFSYTVYSWAKAPINTDGEGVTVRKNGEIVAELVCAIAARSSTDWSAFAKAKLPIIFDNEP